MSNDANSPTQSADCVCGDTKLKSLLESWDLIELYPKLTENGYTFRTLKYVTPSDLNGLIGGDVHLNGPMIIFRSLVTEWKEDSGKTSSDTLHKQKFADEEDLETLIGSSEKGREILKYRNAKTSLSEALKKDLAKIIVDDTFQQNLTLSRGEMKHIAHLICVIFQKEKEHIYYDKRPGQEPTGELYVYHNNALRALRKRKAATSEKQLTAEEQLEQSLTGEVQTSLDFLKTDELQNASTTLIHWKATFNYRKIKIGMMDVTEVLTDWSHLTVVDGFILITSDFGMKHGEENTNALISGWDNFLSNKVDRILDLVNNPVIAKDLRKAKSSNNADVKNKALLMALHHILIPSATTVKGKRWTPTILDSKNAFLTVVKRLSDIKGKIDERRHHCRVKDFKFHPMIFEIETGNNFIVVFHDIRYEFDSLVHATDIAFKIFDFFEISYPLECKNFWSFLQDYFYKTRTIEKLCHKGKMLVEQLSQEC